MGQADLLPVAGRIRVVSWNIRYGIDVAGAIGTFARSAVLTDADIVLLQEMDETGTAAIAAALGLAYVYRRASVHRFHGNDFGNAVLSRWPLVGAEPVLLPHRAAVRGAARVATRATVQVGQVDVVVYSVHTEIPALRLAARIMQFDQVAADAHSLPPGPVIVGGDFNTVTARGVRALVASMGAAGLVPASHPSAPSFRRFGVAMRMDHIFAARLAVAQAGVERDTTASDHRPVWADVAWPPTEAPRMTSRN